jgi:quinoprotein glucose dehydrogenase
MPRLLTALPLLALALGLVAAEPQAKRPAAPPPADDAAARVGLADKGLKVEAWAAEPHLANPVAFAFDEKGRCYVAETFRHTDGVPDTRGKPWRDDDLACRTVADRVAMLQKHKYGQYPQNSERLRLVWDSDGDGKADKDTVFADGFNRYDDGIAAGVLARKGDVYFACVPDLYRFRDPKGENKATEKTSLATGFGVHVQYIGHDLHGLRMGPDGKLYFTVGDRGLNVTTKDGKKLFNPDSGAVLRCDPDGANLEVVHVGLRNPQELAFDDRGNLFTWDNNSDSGDRARWVLVVEGGDSGWRCGFQYGTGYHTPAVPQGNRGPWNTEKLWLPPWDGQAAYIVPALANFGNGPSGITHYPGVGLDDKYKDHFFLTDFTGGPGGSKVWALAVKPKGAAFEVADGGPKAFATNLLPTDCEFGPDGAFYVLDWTDGWSRPGKGRIFRVTDPAAMKNPAVAEAKKLLAEGFEKKSVEELAKLLGHPHQQVRQEAQFELAGRKPEEATKAFAGVLKESKDQPARLHAVWGLGMIRPAPQELLVALKDADPEVKCAAIKPLGDVIRFTGQYHGPEECQPVIRGLIADPDPRVRAAAAVAYGKIGVKPSRVFPGSDPEYFAPLFDLLKANADKDPYLRHAAVMGLFHAARNPADLWNVWAAAKDKYDVPAVRMGVLLALRKHGSDKVAEFLADADPKVVADAARAVYDDRHLNVFPSLAALADKPGQPDPVAFRALAANFWLGTPEAAARVAKFAGRAGETDYARVFALQLLADWTAPPRRDPVTGLTADLPKRDAKVAADAVRPQGLALFTGSDAVRREAAQVAAKLGVKEFGPLMAGLVRDAKAPVGVRAEALFAVEALKDSSAKELAALALASAEPKLRAAGRAVRSHLEPAAVLNELPGLLKDEAASVAERQGAFAILGGFAESAAADKLLDQWLDAAVAGKVPGELLVDLLEAADARVERDRGKEKFALHAPLEQKVKAYRAARAKAAADPKGDKLAAHLDALAGGDADRGRAVVLGNMAVSCQKCHQLGGQGGEVGPALDGLAADKEKDRRYLLEAVVYPSAKIAKGYETLILVLTDETTVSGVVKSEDKKQIRLVTPENKEVVVAAGDVAARRTGPSAMPDDLHAKLTRRELRDVVEFLAGLKDPPKK